MFRLSCLYKLSIIHKVIHKNHSFLFQVHRMRNICLRFCFFVPFVAANCPKKIDTCLSFGQPQKRILYDIGIHTCIKECLYRKTCQSIKYNTQPFHWESPLEGLMTSSLMEFLTPTISSFTYWILYGYLFILYDVFCLYAFDTFGSAFFLKF